MSVVLGLDVSTTATKAVAIRPDGTVAAAASSDYAYETPRPLWSEQDPARWWEGTVTVVRAVLEAGGLRGADVEAIGLAGQMHGLVLLDRERRVLRPAILWNDQRTGAECDLIREVVGRDRLIRLTGNDALPGFTAPKIVWVHRHEPDVWRRIAHVLLPKDQVRFRLTGELATDRADASGTLLLSLADRDWSPEVVEALDVDPSWLPRTYEGPDVTGVLSADAAEATGLRAGTPVVAGGGDQAAAAAGLGAVRPGIVSVSLGTSGVVFATTDGPSVDPGGRLHAFCHAVPDRWHVMGVMLSAAGSLRWLRDAIAPGTAFDELVEQASGVPAGSDGLLFLPYLTGDRTPHPDPLARGAFVGLTVRHGGPHLVRAVLEGVAFGLRDSFELMDALGLPRPAHVRITGGGSRSALWRRVLADVVRTSVVTTSSAEGAAQGAATLAAVGAGWFPTVDAACGATIELGEPIDPGPDADTYDEGYGRYRTLYPALRPTFHATPA
ncbi:MAG: xylulokinase [Actinomycetota bacterium]